ncbi:MAG: hypothetical protein AAF438_16570 [Pseudomonadota bacterium]
MRYGKHAPEGQLWTLRVNSFCWRRSALVLVLFGLAGCAQAPDLLAFGGATTAKVDLTGDWQRDTVLEQEKQDLVLGESLPVELETRRAPRSNQRSRRNQGPSPALILDGLYFHARKLRLTQEATALFVKFDLARVREYRYGEKTDANVGVVGVLRVSGWENDTYLIKSVSDDGTLIQERYSLEERGLRLVRQITISSKSMDEPRVMVQNYSRAP